MGKYFIIHELTLPLLPGGTKKCTLFAYGLGEEIRFKNIFICFSRRFSIECRGRGFRELLDFVREGRVLAAGLIFAVELSSCILRLQ